MHEFLFEMVTALVFTLKYEDSYYRRRNVIKTPVRYNYREGVSLSELRIDICRGSP